MVILEYDRCNIWCVILHTIWQITNYVILLKKYVTLFWNYLSVVRRFFLVSIKLAESGIAEAWYLWIAWGPLQDRSLLRNLQYEAGVHQTQLPRRRRLVCKNTCHQRQCWCRDAKHLQAFFCEKNKPLSPNETTGLVCLYSGHSGS